MKKILFCFAALGAMALSGCTFTPCCDTTLIIATPDELVFNADGTPSIPGLDFFTINSPAPFEICVPWDAWLNLTGGVGTNTITVAPDPWTGLTDREAEIVLFSPNGTTITLTIKQLAVVLEIVPDDDPLEFDWDGTYLGANSTNVDIIYPGAWTIVCPDWIEVSTLSGTPDGTGDETVSFTAKLNGIGDRTDQIEFQVGGVTVATLDVWQDEISTTDMAALFPLTGVQFGRWYGPTHPDLLVVEIFFDHTVFVDYLDNTKIRVITKLVERSTGDVVCTAESTPNMIDEAAPYWPTNTVVPFSVIETFFYDLSTQQVITPTFGSTGIDEATYPTMASVAADYQVVVEFYYDGAKFEVESL